MKESTLRQQVLSYLRRRYPAGRFCGYPRYSMGAGGGEPDIYGCIGGLMIQIELKVGNNKPTERQALVGELWRRAGATYVVAWTVEDVRRGLAWIEA